MHQKSAEPVERRVGFLARVSLVLGDFAELFETLLHHLVVFEAIRVD